MLSAMAAPPALAVDGVIDGSPLNVYANDVGRLQAAFDGVASGEFYTGALMPNDGGISVAVQAGRRQRLHGLRPRRREDPHPGVGAGAHGQRQSRALRGG